jgi:hypothetical protein
LLSPLIGYIFVSQFYSSKFQPVQSVRVYSSLLITLSLTSKCIPLFLIWYALMSPIHSKTITLQEF